jgi:PHD/YefM family antitoxin component YafN of YafNO toxin-antitoxin module
MKLSEAVTPISKAKAVLIDLASYEQVQESLALLKILAQSSASVAAGRVRTAKKVLKDLRASCGGASA